MGEYRRISSFYYGRNERIVTDLVLPRTVTRKKRGKWVKWEHERFTTTTTTRRERRWMGAHFNWISTWAEWQLNKWRTMLWMNEGCLQRHRCFRCFRRWGTKWLSWPTCNDTKRIRRRFRTGWKTNKRKSANQTTCKTNSATTETTFYRTRYQSVSLNYKSTLVRQPT